MALWSIKSAERNMTFSQKVWPRQFGYYTAVICAVQFPQLITLGDLETTQYFSFLINRINVGTNHKLGR